MSSKKKSNPTLLDLSEAKLPASPNEAKLKTFSSPTRLEQSNAAAAGLSIS
ncbi:MAG: hypothetical protein M3Y03_03785 [Verrucomicrobiota bacterium]|nr:hypothetical protein [Verrucomicrobiota bacterium]